MDADLPRDEKIRRLRSRLDELNRAFVHERSEGFSVNDVRRSIRGSRKPTEAPTPPPRSPRTPIVYRRDLPRQESVGGPAPCAAPAVPVALDDVVDAEEIRDESGRICLLITTEVASIDGRESLSSTLSAQLQDGASRLAGIMSSASGRDHTRNPQEMLFVDIETTGLNNVPLFLIGVMRWEGAGLRVKQYLARTYAEEAAVIGAFADTVLPEAVLVTFNGKSFDIPYIRTRAIANGVSFVAPERHIDLLHESRRVWRGVLPDCKLQTLESLVCGHQRCGDIPGSEIGDAYHAFVRTGNAGQVVEILKHNMLDLVTLAEIMMHLR